MANVFEGGVMAGLKIIQTEVIKVKPTFTNTPNKVAYLSRHVAVMVVPVFYCGNTLYVPLGQRSGKVSDSGKWCLPCGYLDWDESAQDAVIREAYEELGLDLRVLN